MAADLQSAVRGTGQNGASCGLSTHVNLLGRQEPLSSANDAKHGGPTRCRPVSFALQMRRATVITMSPKMERAHGVSPCVSCDDRFASGWVRWLPLRAKSGGSRGSCNLTNGPLKRRLPVWLWLDSRESGAVTRACAGLSGMAIQCVAVYASTAWPPQRELHSCPPIESRCVLAARR